MEKRLGLLLHFSLTSRVVSLGVGAYHGSRDGEEQVSVSVQSVAFSRLMLLIGICVTDTLALVSPCDGSLGIWEGSPQGTVSTLLF